MKKTEEFKVNFEDVFEKHNPKVQVLIFLVSLIVGAWYNIGLENELGIVIGLLFLISGELISLSVKDCIVQRKLNSMGTKIEILRGALVRVHDFDLTDFFNKTRGEFYISGIALNGFFDNNKSTIEKFLEEGKEVDVLLASPKSIKANAILYHGLDENKQKVAKNENNLLNKQIATLDNIERIPNIFSYMKNGKFKLKVLDSTFSTSFVAYDIFENDILLQKKKGKELKASFYQYKCTEPRNEPNIVVDSFFSRDWYMFFKNCIKMQWDDGKIVRTQGEFEELRETLNNMMQFNRNIINRE